MLQKAFMGNLNKIENIFIEEFKDFEETLTLEEIESMNKQIIKRNFYSFLPYQFNIYYANLLLACLLTNLGFIGQYISSKFDITHSNEIKSSNFKQKENTNTLPSNDFNRGDKPINLKKSSSNHLNNIVPSLETENNEIDKNIESNHNI